MNLVKFCDECESVWDEDELTNGLCTSCLKKNMKMTLAKCRACDDISNENHLEKGLCVHCAAGFKRCEDCKEWYKKYELHDGCCSDCAGTKCHVCGTYDHDENLCTKCELDTCADCLFSFETKRSEEEWCRKCVDELRGQIYKWNLIVFP